MGAVKRPTKEIALALMNAAVDDLRHTDNMADRVNYYLGLDASSDYVDYRDIVYACEWLAANVIPAQAEPETRERYKEKLQQ